MTNKPTTPYKQFNTWTGYKLEQATHKWESVFLKTAREYAKDETAKYGRKIAVVTLLINIVLRDREFKRRYNENILKQKENTPDEAKNRKIDKEFS